MSREFTVRWEGDLAGPPERVWDAITARGAGWIWPITYEPRLGGAEKGLGGEAGTVTAWAPAEHLATSAADGDGVNALDHRLTASASGTHLSYTHRGVIAGDYDTELDACRQHTDFYYHSLGEYVAHFAGRDAVYVSADAPPTSADGGFAALKRALGLPDDVAVGDKVTLTPAGMAPIEGVVDYTTPAFLGVRAEDALYRFYGRDFWGWPVGVAHHFFGTDAAPAAWSTWLTDVFSDGAVN
jgi:uncharacterized protein YndB with AHSA1/START domain